MSAFGALSGKEAFILLNIFHLKYADCGFLKNKIKKNYKADDDELFK